MLQFDSNGNLHPPQIIEIDFESFRTTFVDAVEGSRTRNLIFEQYLDYTNALQELLNVPFYQWIDGSFVTKKLNPIDIDLVTFVDFEGYRAKEREIDKIRAKRIKRDNLVDGYFIAVYPQDHRLGKLYEIECKKWLFEFGTSKDNKDKGILQINL